MIGGRDIVVDGRTTPNDGTVVIETFRRMWPALVVQDANQPSPTETPAFDAREFFVYRDQEAFASWREHGATSENADRLIHVIIENDRVTFVVASDDSETYRLAKMAIAERCRTCGQLVVPEKTPKERLHQNLFVWTFMSVFLWGTILSVPPQWTVAWWSARTHVWLPLTVVPAVAIYFWAQFLCARWRK